MSLNGDISNLLQNLQQQVPAPVFAKLGEMFERLHVDGVATHIPAVGEQVPAVSFVDDHGNTTTLAELLSAGPLILMFYRGGWCPFCDLTLRAYEASYPEIQALGARLVAVSPQTEHKSRETGESRALSFRFCAIPIMPRPKALA